MAYSKKNQARLLEQYWNEMVHLKAYAAYIALYRDSMGKWVTALSLLKALASSTGIAAWAIWQRYAFIWGGIIAASQLADALKDVFPFTKKFKAASDLCRTLDSLFIDTQLEWENVQSAHYSPDEIMKRLYRLRKLQLDAEQKNFPDGLAQKDALRDKAQHAAELYFSTQS